MIEDYVLRRLSAERNIGLDIIEKDYVLGWILKGISETSVNNRIIFKGGTALSKVHFPLDWRLSEDLDFTLLDETSMTHISETLWDELPMIIGEESQGIRAEYKNPYVTDYFLRATIGFTGPITRHNTKIEVTQERFIGEWSKFKVPETYDYPPFYLNTYTINNILAEKLRSLIERNKIRDYYDTWRILDKKVADLNRVKELFYKKCEGKNIAFTSTDQFFPEGISEILEPFHSELTRLTQDEPPPIKTLIKELKNHTETLF
jgi:hypothetical protein